MIRITKDPRTGLSTLEANDRFEWERELRVTERPNGDVQIEVLVQRAGVFETTETFLLTNEQAHVLGGHLLAGARQRRRETER